MLTPGFLAARKKGGSGNQGSEYSFKTGDAIDEDEQMEIEVLLFRNAAICLSKEMLAKMPNLKLVQSFSAGVDYLRCEDISKEIIVCGNGGACAEPIAEHFFWPDACPPKGSICPPAELE